MKKNDRRKRKLQEEACDYEIERTPTTRYEPDYEEGLTSAQAEELLSLLLLRIWKFCDSTG